MATQESPEDKEPGAEEVNPYQAPVIEVAASVSSSPLVEALRRRSGNELIYTALACSVFGFFFGPAGFVLDFLSMFFLLRVVIARHKPTPLCIFLGVVVGLWNLLRMFVLLLIILMIVRQRFL